MKLMSFKVLLLLLLTEIDDDNLLWCQLQKCSIPLHSQI